MKIIWGDGYFIGRVQLNTDFKVVAVGDAEKTKPGWKKCFLIKCKRFIGNVVLILWYTNNTIGMIQTSLAISSKF